MKTAIWTLLTSVIVTFIYLSFIEIPKVQEVKEVSMFKFLYSALHEYKETHEHFPRTIEEGIDKGLLDHFPKDRIDYLNNVMSEGRLDYFFLEEGVYRMRLRTCREREFTMDGSLE